VVSAPDIPGHRVAGVLGKGGFATVYRSWQLAVGREVAVKVDNRVLLSDRDRRRFVREVTAAGRLSGHPHVIDVYDAGTLGDGRPYLVMELCPAGSLNDALRRHGPMSPGQVRDIGIRIADALAAAHAAGILHRDIKPANILINRYGMVGLSDFGLASIMAAEGEQSATRDTLTPAYAPPESFRGEDPTVAADLYSLAATLYALLTGRPPRFPADGRSPDIVAIMMLHNKPVDDVPGTPPELMALLRRSLAPDPAVRPPSAAALRDALVALTAWPAGPSPQAARPAGPRGQPRPAVLPERAPSTGNAGPLHTQVPAAAPIPAGNPFPNSLPVPARPGSDGTQAGYAPGGSPAGSGPHGMPAGSGPDRTPAGPGPAGPPAGFDPVGPPARSGLHGTPARPGSDGIPAGRAPASPSGHRRRPLVRSIALAAGLVMIVGAAAIIGARILPHGASAGAAQGATSSSNPGAGSAAAPGVFGVATVTSGCPAATVRGAAAQCPAAPECWNGPVIIAGNVTDRSLPCNAAHGWQTFAIAILPADAQTYDVNIVQTNPSVRAVCSTAVLLKSRRGPALRIPGSAWEIYVLPPDEAAFSSGARAYRCIAHVLSGTAPSTSQFGG